MNQYFHTIYLDMDGVIANFHLEAVRAHLRVGKRIKGLVHFGTPLELTEQVLFKQYPKGVSLSKWLVPEITDETNHWHADMDKFWQPIDEDPLFWQNLPAFSYAKELLKMLDAYCKHLVILTTPHTHPNSYHGKRRWLERNGLAHMELIYCKRKWRLADPRCLLIDDFEVHVNSWLEECEARYEKPGSAILFPAPWNESHKLARDHVGYIQQRITEILQG